MNGYCVVVLDNRRARFFSLSGARVPRNRSGPVLVEERDLVNPEAEMRDRDLFTDTQTGCNRSMGGVAHRYDDHRGHHRESLSQHFARRVVHEARAMAQDMGADSVILSSSSSMLGVLRKEAALVHEPRTWKVVQGDMARMPPREIHDLLARKDIIPAMTPPSAPATNRAGR